MAQQAIRLEEVAFSYPQDGHGLPPFSLNVAEGEGVLLSGPSGCGKSTLARLACGLIPHLYHGKLKGRAWLNDLPTAETPLWKLSEQAGLVFQNPAAQILTSSVDEEILFGLENLGISRQEMALRLEETLLRFELLEMRSRAPQTLSGGEQQKLALACMLARRTPILVLDEPLSMLDSTFAHQFTGYLSDLLNSGHTLLVCEHRTVFLRHIAELRSVPLQSPHPAPEEGLEAGIVPGGHVRRQFTLQVDGLSVERGGRTVLQDVNFSLPGGQWVALIGRNGSGKTTLLRTLAGLQPFTGNVQVQTPSGPESPSLSMVFQNPDLQLFNPTVREEILYRISDPDLQWYGWLVQALGLLHYESTPPLLLSEGEKRRTALATALMRRAQHGILLDEPSLGQDDRHKSILARTLRCLAQAGYLVVTATHDLELAAHADSMLLLTPQGILAHGPTGQILRQTGLWQQLGLWLPEWVQGTP